MNADGSNPVNLTNHSAFDGSPDWSRDGQHIVFRSNRDDAERSDLYIMNADGSNVTRLTTGLSAIRSVWSPTSDVIAFLGRSEEFGLNIYRVDAAGSNLTRLTDDSGDKGELQWLPDGSGIAYLYGPQLRTVNLDGTIHDILMTFPDPQYVSIGGFDIIAIDAAPAPTPTPE